MSHRRRRRRRVRSRAAKAHVTYRTPDILCTYVRTLANVESTGSTDLISPARGDSRLFPSTLSVSPIFSEDFTLCTHLLVVSTSLDGVLQLNSGDAIPPDFFSLDLCVCRHTLVQKSHGFPLILYHASLRSAWPMQGDGNEAGLVQKNMTRRHGRLVQEQKSDRTRIRTPRCMNGALTTALPSQEVTSQRKIMGQSVDSLN